MLLRASVSMSDLVSYKGRSHSNFHSTMDAALSGNILPTGPEPAGTGGSGGAKNTSSVAKHCGQRIFKKALSLPVPGGAPVHAHHRRGHHQRHQQDFFAPPDDAKVMIARETPRGKNVRTTAKNRKLVAYVNERKTKDATTSNAIPRASANARPSHSPSMSDLMPRESETSDAENGTTLRRPKNDAKHAPGVSSNAGGGGSAARSTGGRGRLVRSHTLSSDVAAVASRGRGRDFFFVSNDGARDETSENAGNNDAAEGRDDDDDREDLEAAGREDRKAPGAPPAPPPPEEGGGRRAAAPPAAPPRRSGPFAAVAAAAGDARTGREAAAAADENPREEAILRDDAAAGELRRAVLAARWPDAIRLLARRRLRPEAAAEAASRPVTFRFRGERSSATPLHRACALDPPLEVVDALISAAPRSVLAGDEAAGRLPVHVAIVSGADSAVVRRLLTSHPMCGLLQDEEGNNALHFAAMFGGAGAIRAALESSSDESPSYGDADAGGRRGAADAAAAVPNGRGRLPLHLLCARCGREEAGGGGGQQDGGTALAGAAAVAVADSDAIDLGTVRSLLRSHPPAAFRRDKRGRLPLHDACNSRRPRLDVLELLLDADGAPGGCGEGEGTMAAQRDDGGLSPADLLGAVRPDVLRSSSGNGGGGGGPHPTLSRLIRASPRRGIASRAARALLPAGGALLRRRRFNKTDVSSDRRPAGRTSEGNKGGGGRAKVKVDGKLKDDGTYPRHASPVTTVKKRYTLPY